MRTTYAGPLGTCDPDKILDIEDEGEARKIVEAGYAVAVDERGAEVALAPPVKEKKSS